LVLIVDKVVLVLQLLCEQIWIRKTRDALMTTKYQISAKEFRDLRFINAAMFSAKFTTYLFIF